MKKNYAVYPTPKNKWMLYYKDLCSECGCYHLYYKNIDWQKHIYKPMCFRKNKEQHGLGKPVYWHKWMEKGETRANCPCHRKIE